VQPFTLIGSLVFDGNGNIVPNLASPSLTSTTTTGSTGTASSSNTSAVQSAYAMLRYGGTYTVNSDCSGTMTISNSAAVSALSGSSTSMTGTGTTAGTGTTTDTGTGTTGTTSTTSVTPESFTANFVLTQPDVTVANGTNLNNYRLAPGIEFVSSSTAESASGYASPE
jgi:hypothetical protein